MLLRVLGGAAFLPDVKNPIEHALNPIVGKRAGAPDAAEQVDH